ncbi:MAG: MBL fold metallo-hydrolase [bacterium]
MKKFLIAVLGIFLISVFLLLQINFNDEQKLKVVFFNIGQGDSSIIFFKDKSKMLIDCGPDKKVIASLGNYLPFYDRTIDYLLITHFDLDHYGGCIDVLKRYKVKNIIVNGDIKTGDHYWVEWEKQKNKEGAQEIIIYAPAVWQMAGADIDFWWPKMVADFIPKDSNDKSIVFRLQADDFSILFTGDMEEQLENYLIKNLCKVGRSPCPSLHAEILKVGHHGSKSSTGQDFLNAVSPSRAIVSVGKNRFGHPSERIMFRLRRSGVEILRTDLIGDIIIE